MPNTFDISARTTLPPTLLCHEWLAPHGGSENVFEQIAAAIPGSDLQCLWNDAPERFHGVAETWLARTPLRRSKPAALPLMSAAWRSVDLDPYERVISSSHAFGHQLAARAAEAGKEAYAYVHTPARYVWFAEFDERGNTVAARSAAALLKRQDRKRSSAKVHYAANSEFVRTRIQQVWDVDAEVIYPPVAVERIQSVANWADRVSGPEVEILAALPDTFILGASRLIEYKRLDLAMEVGQSLGLPVVIAGDGPYAPELKAMGAAMTVPVLFTGRVSDELLYALYQRASLFVFMAIEDFGIMPVEAIAAGTPALVNEMGGSSESVASSGAGAAARIDHADSILAAAKVALDLDRSEIAAAADRFSESNFRRAITTWTASA